MELFFLLSLAVGVVGVIGQVPAEPYSSSEFQCETEGFHPDPNNCAVFYRCVYLWGRLRLHPVRFQCKEPAVFDPSIRACQFPWRLKPPCVKNSVGVWVRETSPSSPSVSVLDVLPNITVLELGSPDYITKAPPTYQVADDSPFACPGPGEYFADIGGSCVFYYQCVETAPGILSATLYRCKTGEIFTETTGQCLRPYELPPCGQNDEVLLRSGITDIAAVEEDLYDDRDFYLELEFKK